MVTSTKSMTGHLLGAAGALESVATVLALHDRVVPPTINLDDPEDVGLDLATKRRDLPAGDLAALNNSFGFGGHNVAWPSGASERSDDLVQPADRGALAGVPEGLELVVPRLAEQLVDLVDERGVAERRP